MTAVLAVPKSSRHYHRPLVLLLVWAGLLNPRALAENTVPLPASPAANKPQEKRNDPFWWSDRFDRVRMTNPNTTSYYFLSDPLTTSAKASYVFFPPVPPPLGADFPLLGRLVPGAPPAPPELAAFVNELFYPMLGARLAASDLPQGLWQQIQAFLATRTGLQNELRSRIAALKEADFQTREVQLVAFAALQTPRIAALETAAEKIRTDLHQTGIFGFQADSDAASEEAVRLLPAGRIATPGTQDLRLESELMRRAAYYEKGLSPAQRHLLLEAAIELESQPDAAQAPSRTTTEGRLLHFSPETARVTVPAGLSAPLEKLINDYVAVKNGLKAELRDALLSNEPASDACAQALRRLAVAQASRLAAVEVTAEEIRRGLATLPNPPGPPPPPSLPPELVARISAYRGHKLELLRTLHGMLAGVRERADPAARRESAKASGSRASALTVMSDGVSAAQNKQMSLQESVAEFNRKQTALIAELNIETSGIREALAEYVRTTGQPGDRKSIDDLLKDFENARQKQEVWDKFRDYQVAVLMPGLSPEQRRLLFDAAVEQLALPLPSGRMVH